MSEAEKLVRSYWFDVSTNEEGTVFVSWLGKPTPLARDWDEAAKITRDHAEHEASRAFRTAPPTSMMNDRKARFYNRLNEVFPEPPPSPPDPNARILMIDPEQPWDRMAKSFGRAVGVLPVERDEVEAYVRTFARVLLGDYERRIRDLQKIADDIANASTKPIFVSKDSITGTGAKNA